MDQIEILKAQQAWRKAIANGESAAEKAAGEALLRCSESTAVFTAQRESFAGLRYSNPPGGTKTCLNTKLARCELIVERKGEPSRVLLAEHRAAFEILTDNTQHGVRLDI